MAHITACTKCGSLYEESNEEAANEPVRLCFRCYSANDDADYAADDALKQVPDDDEDDGYEGDDEELDAPGGERAVDRGCTCHARMARPTDIDPPEVTVDRNCPLHGQDPDEAYERMRDREIEEL